MKKLKSKVFLVIFLILTMFLTTILVVSNYQNYQNQRNNIKATLFRMEENRNPNPQPRIFMDSRIYAVRLDVDNRVIEIINHTPDVVNEEKIRKLAEKIMSEKKNEKVKISNLIFNNYS